MSKLIDADALCAALEAVGSDMSKTPLTRIAMTWVRVDLAPSLPDASEPLRARIAELEDKLRYLNQACSAQGSVSYSTDNPVYWEIWRLLKGAQDA